MVRRQIERFNSGESSWVESCDALGVSRARLYTLRHEWLKDRDGFVPGLSGGDRSGEWPRECEALALELLNIGPVNFALIADEMDSRFGFRRSRAAVRDYLGITSGAAVSWRFVENEEVPEGPWIHEKPKSSKNEIILGEN